MASGIDFCMSLSLLLSYSCFVSVLILDPGVSTRTNTLVFLLPLIITGIIISCFSGE